MAVAERETGLQATLEYRRELFDEDRIARLAGHYEQLLRSIIRANGPCFFSNFMAMRVERAYNVRESPRRVNRCPVGRRSP